jgi:hypothetical protein
MFKQERHAMNKLLTALALALGVLAGPASAVVICDNCTYLTGQPATNLGQHDPTTFDNSTFGNATTGQNGNFDNTWVFSINPAGNAGLDVIFLPIANISNFAVKLFDVESSLCGGAGSACSSLTLGGLLATSTTVPNYASVLDFTGPLNGTYAFEVTGTISGLAAGQPASYVGNLQTVAAVPEPETYALLAGGLGMVGFMARRRKPQA